MRLQYYSIRIELNEVLKDAAYEQLVFENLERCRRLVGVRFKVIFWHNKLDKKIIEDFTTENKDKLFKLGSHITGQMTNVWFLIKSSEEEVSDARYRYEGDILEGIVEYLKIINHMNKRDN